MCSCFVFVYQNKKTKEFKCYDHLHAVYQEGLPDFKKKWKHVATLVAPVWIEKKLNEMTELAKSF